MPLGIRVALGCLAAFTALSYLSILWAGAPGDAWEGANRTLLYLLVFALFAGWRQQPLTAAILLGAWTLAISGLAPVRPASHRRGRLGSVEHAAAWRPARLPERLRQRQRRPVADGLLAGGPAGTQPAPALGASRAAGRLCRAARRGRPPEPEPRLALRDAGDAPRGLPAAPGTHQDLRDARAGGRGDRARRAGGAACRRSAQRRTGRRRDAPSRCRRDAPLLGSRCPPRLGRCGDRVPPHPARGFGTASAPGHGSRGARRPRARDRRRTGGSRKSRGAGRTRLEHLQGRLRSQQQDRRPARQRPG